MARLGISRARRRGRGQTLVEFALTIPIVIFMFMGIFDLGRAVYQINALSDAARNGVREAIVNQDCTAITTRAKSAAPAVDLSAANAIAITVYKSAMPVNTPTPDTCTGGLAGNYGIGWLAEVKATTTFNAITPMISQIIGPMSLSSTARLPIERAYP